MRSRSGLLPSSPCSCTKYVISRLVHANPKARLATETRKNTLFRHQLLRIIFSVTFSIIILSIWFPFILHYSILSRPCPKRKPVVIPQHPYCSVTASKLQHCCIHICSLSAYLFAVTLQLACSLSAAFPLSGKPLSGLYSLFTTSAGLTCAARCTCHITVSSDSRAVMRKATTNSPGVSGALWAKPCK